MKCVSPLRYPGGKSTMASLLSQIRKLNELENRSMAEAYAGGAGASLSLLCLGETPKVYINDADSAIHDFWWALVKKPDDFISMLSNKRVSMAEWYRQRDIYNSPKRISRLSRGFSAFYLNRCNRSGIIINGGPIGGLDQSGDWQITARFNKSALRRRCEKIAEFRKQVEVSCLDGIDFISSLDQESSFFFIDPPYFEKGKTLYLNSLDNKYHATLAMRLKSMTKASWVLTYDDCPEIRRLYRGWSQIRPFTLRYSAAARRRGKEILIAPKWMRLPGCQESAAIIW